MTNREKRFINLFSSYNSKCYKIWGGHYYRLIFFENISWFFGNVFNHIFVGVVFTKLEISLAKYVFWHLKKTSAEES